MKVNILGTVYNILPCKIAPKMDEKNTIFIFKVKNQINLSMFIEGAFNVIIWHFHELTCMLVALLKTIRPFLLVYYQSCVLTSLVGSKTKHRKLREIYLTLSWNLHVSAIKNINSKSDIKTNNTRSTSLFNGYFFETGLIR